MFKYIQKLQQKPESYRKRFAFITSASFSLVLALIWVSVLISNPETVRIQGEDIPKTQTATPFSAITKDLKSTLQSFSEGVSDLKKTINTIAQTSTTSTSTPELVTSDETELVSEETETPNTYNSFEIIQVLTDDPDYIDQYLQEPVQ